MPRCPQCTRFYLDDKIFQPPVRTCLPCYGRLPANRDLWDVMMDALADPGARQKAWDVLRARAARSKYARKKRSSNVMLATDGLEIGDRVAEVASVGAMKALDLDVRPDKLMPCDTCKKMVVELSELPGPGIERPLVCNACLETPEILDAQCALCQVRFPLSAMWAKEGKFRCEECQDRYSKFTHTT